MAQLTPGITYWQIKQVTDWQLTEEALRQALAKLVNAISNLEVPKAWGTGQASSSDGQRFRLRRKVLQQTYSPRFHDYAIEFYSFVADNYAPFYSTVIECTDRDAAYVMDGVDAGMRATPSCECSGQRFSRKKPATPLPLIRGADGLLYNEIKMSVFIFLFNLIALV